MLGQGEANIQPLLGEVNRAKEILVDMGKMVALQLEGSVVTTENALEDALVGLTIGRILQCTHALLQPFIAARKALQDGRGVSRTTSNVVIPTIGIDDSNLHRVRSSVRNICARLCNGQS